MTAANESKEFIETLTWVSHPAKLRPLATVVVAVFILLMFWIVFALTQSGLMVLLTGAIFVGALWTFFFPTRYDLNKSKVKVQFTFSTREKDMTSFRSYYPDKNGVLLSPFVKPSRLENFRGLYLRYHQNKDEVDAFIKRIFVERSQPEASQIGS